jgi:hypothetical protein
MVLEIFPVLPVRIILQGPGLPTRIYLAGILEASSGD